LSLDVIAQLWAAGESFTGVGLKLGGSRSIVAGRIDRAHKSGDPRFPPRPPDLPPGLVRLRVAVRND
jgi:hypothetical protein